MHEQANKIIIIIFKNVIKMFLSIYIYFKIIFIIMWY